MAEMIYSRLGASSCKRWLNCPGSVSLLASLPETNDSSVYAAEGTCAHEICEHYLRFGIPTVAIEDNGQLGEKVEVDNHEITITAEMLESCRLYAETILKDMVDAGLVIPHSSNKYPINPAFLNIEQKFVIESIDKELSGTNDASVWNPNTKKLTVYDFKYGKGVPVEAEHNEQLMFYTLGVMDKLKLSPESISSFELVIIQPRCPHSDGPIRRWEGTQADLISFKNTLAEGVKAVRSANPKYESGSHCRWCRAKAICPLYRQKVNEAAQMDFAPVAVDNGKEPVLTPPKVEDLTIEQISHIMKLVPVVEDFISEVQSKAAELLGQGLEVPGFKLVQKRANRQWIDEDAVAEAFGDVALEKPKVKSPAKLEKIVGKEKILDYVMTPEAGVTVVPESDKRQAVVPVQQAFDCFELPMDI